MQGLIIKKLADKTGGQNDDGSWPLAGISLLLAPDVTTISTTLVTQGRAEGWISVEGERVETRPGGPAADPWRDTHTFHHLDTIILHALEGDVRYTVVHQPDKYVADGDDDTLVTNEHYAAGNTRVDWFYRIEKEQ